MSSYFGNIRKGLKTSWSGMRVTWQHLLDARQKRQPFNVQEPNYFGQSKGIVTMQYPHETMTVPDHGRYQLACEMDDCIVCDKCAKICPVDCIDIETIKSPELIGHTSDGSPIRLYAAKFDIDMAKCCFCGLCTTVCPTECLTMTNKYDFSAFDVTNFNFEFSNLTAEQAAEKRSLYEQFVAEKQSNLGTKQTSSEPLGEKKDEVKSSPARPVFKPSFKKTESKAAEIEPQITDNEAIAEPILPKPKPVFKPSFKKTESNVAEIESKIAEKEAIVEPILPKPKPVFKSSFKKTESKAAETEPPIADNEAIAEPILPKSKPVFKPSFKKTESKTAEIEPQIANNEAIAERILPKSKPVFKPSYKKTESNAVETKPQIADNEAITEPILPKPKPVFKPSFKKTESKIAEIEPQIVDNEAIAEPILLKPKPVFKPSYKPKPPKLEE